MPRTAKVVGSVSVNPEAFNIVHAKLTHHDSKELDIKKLVQKIEIYEDINKPFLEVILYVRDSTNLLEFAQINGHEQISLKIQRQAGGEDRDSKEKFELSLHIAEVFNYVRQDPGTQYYKLRCVSKHLYINQTKALRRSFQGSIGQLVKNICDKDLGIEKCEINTDTQEVIKGIYPTLRPIQSVNWLLRNAFDNGTPYYFYETTQDGVQFNSYENLLEQEIYNEYEFKPYFEFEMGTKEAYDEQSRRINQFGSELGMSKLEAMANGSYASTLHSLDISKKSYKKSFFDYEKSTPKKINKNKPFSDLTKFKDRKLNELKEGKHHFISRNTDAYPSHKNYHEPNHITLLKAQSHLSTMNFMTQNFSISGDFNMTVGKKIKLKIVQSSDTLEQEQPTVPLDRFLGDNYLVTGVTHMIGPESYTMQLKVQKDSIERGIE
jgi:hypothetical protein